MASCIIGVAIVLGVARAASAATNPSDEAYQADLFAGRTVLRLQIEIPPAGIRELTRHEWNGGQRAFALAKVSEGGEVFTNVEVHLKGGAGSFRPIDDNPALTLNFAKYASGQMFHGLKKFSLNNSVQDPTFLNEKICRELFNSAGSPTPQAGFTTVQLNGRNLGIHVLTEGANKQFLRHFFKNVHGNLYQTHGNQEITDRLDVNSGDDPTDDSGLRALVQAVKQEDAAARWSRLQQTLDVDRFLTFMGLEIMLCHWDGYCMNQNNWRIFHDLEANKMVFIAHGMDQMFGTGAMLLGGDKSSARCPIFPEWHGAVAEAVMSTPEGRRLYLARLGQLYTNFFRVDVLLKRVDELSTVVGQALADTGGRAARDYERRIENLKAHIQDRHESLGRQLAVAFKPRDPQSVAPLRLTGWSTRVQEGRPEFGRGADGSRHELLHVSAPQGRAAGSWRTRLRLEPGRYRFEGDVRVQGVDSADEWAGARLRISGGRPVRKLSDSADWKTFTYEFQVGENHDIEFVCELRASAGEAWFDEETLQVVRVE